MPTGSIQIYATAAGQTAPLAGVTVAVLDETGARLVTLTTDTAGAAEAKDLPAPDAAYSLDETNTTVRPYAVYRLRAEAPDWQSTVVEGVQVFDGQQTVARLEFLPTGGSGDALPAREEEPNTVAIPPHALFAGDGGSGPAPEERLPGNVLNEVVVPKKITVHLGRPAASAKNVTVGFQAYIANVASSEVYPTWEAQTTPSVTGGGAWPGRPAAAGPWQNPPGK